jgi:amino acid transporter
MLFMTTHRPRNVNTTRAAGILYGDWGTSKTYVIGLAFALAGYAAFWQILAVGILSLFVGLNYVIICKFYPNGGGVYASVRRRSKVLAIVGAFFLVADYLVTAALSALAAFNYLGVSDPVTYSAIFILLIGIFNYFGPRHTGTFAFIFAIGAVVIFTLLVLLSLPFLTEGWHNLQAPPRDPLTFWTHFCSVIVALSGVETIANTTSVMKLNPGSSLARPIVTSTSTPAILIVMTEAIVYTTIFGLAATAITNFQFDNQAVSAPGFSNVNDYMLSYLARIFGSKILGAALGTIFSQILKIIVALILLSAVNTAINGLVSLQYLMASDEELPRPFRKLNRYGVPLIPLILTSIIPAILILLFKKIIFLANLYAIGFVGAIATNLGATSTDSKLRLNPTQRIFMFSTFLAMAAIEITLFIQKPDARYFVLIILILGLALRTVAKLLQKRRVPLKAEVTALVQEEKKAAILCAVKKMGGAVRSAVEESNRHKIPLNIVFVREQRVISERDLKRSAETDAGARRVLKYIQANGNPDLIHFYYSVTDSFVDITLAYALRLEAERIIVDTPPNRLLALVRGNYVTTLQKQLPPNISLTALTN